MQADGLNYLHTAGVIHGDIKASNISVLLDGRLEIMNFESAIFMELGRSHKLSNGRLFDHKVDIWALGILSCELLLGVVGLFATFSFFIRHSTLYSQPDTTEGDYAARLAQRLFYWPWVLPQGLQEVIFSVRRS